MKVLVTGADGLVGTHYLKNSENVFDFVCPDEKSMGITDMGVLENTFSAEKPDCVLNFAAYTDTKKAESERNDRNGVVWKVNVSGAENLAKICKKLGIFLVHISTDLVFAGKDSGKEMYYENDDYDDNHSKIGWYGITKLEGEKIIRNVGSDYALIRIAYPFAGPAHPKKDLIHNILNLYDTDKLYPMFSDNTVTPTYINDLALAVNNVIQQRKTGVFHAVSHGPVSHYDLAAYLLEKSGRDKGKLKPGSLEEFSKISGIPRPLHINLDTKLTENELGIKFGSWKENIDKALSNLSL